MVQRQITIELSSSFFLFGARGVGKSTLLHELFDKKDEVYWVDLLDLELEERFSREPGLLEAEVRALPKKVRWVVIDEIQKIPALLNTVHRLIEDRSLNKKFALTGSSARKLRQAGVNLLAGRAYVYDLFPLTHRELGSKFSLDAVLRWGSLPKPYFSKTETSKQIFLESYARSYLKEEIWAEHLIRELNPFRKFLEIAAQSNGELINFANIARDVGADDKTVKNYFHLLEDTLLGTLIEPFHYSIRKRQRTSPKFYFFDTGVKRALELSSGLPLTPSTYGYGDAFEHFILLELIRLSAYHRRNYRFSYLRTRDDVEIDIVIERPGLPLALLEIKSTTDVREQDAHALETLGAEIPKAERFILSRDPKPKIFGKTKALPWQQGLVEVGV